MLCRLGVSGFGLLRSSFRLDSSNLLHFGSFLRLLRSGKALAVKADFHDAHRSVGLTVSAQLLILFLALVVEDEHLIASNFAENTAGDQRFRLRTSNLAIGTGNGQHLWELYTAVVFIFGGRQFFHPNHVTGRYAILLSAGANDCVH